MTDQPNQRRVLFVEDEPALRISYERFFRPRYVMAFASSGAEALARLAEESPDVVVLDMRLPDTAGVRHGLDAVTLRRIREARPTVPVIITTAYVSVEPQLHVLDLAHSAYLIKPFDLDELGAAIDRAG